MFLFFLPDSMAHFFHLFQWKPSIIRDEVLFASFVCFTAHDDFFF